jgi:hypothetical protein
MSKGELSRDKNARNPTTNLTDLAVLFFSNQAGKGIKKKKEKEKGFKYNLNPMTPSQTPKPLMKMVEQDSIITYFAHMCQLCQSINVMCSTQSKS